MEHPPADAWVPAARRPTSPPLTRATAVPASGRTTDPFYRHAGVTVTRDVFEVAGRRYRVAELRNLRTARGEANPATWWVAVLAGSVLAALGVGLSFGSTPSGPSPATYAVLGVAVLAPGLVGLYLRHRARRSHELWADYGDGTYLVYAATDLREFGQVTRALLRAWEAGYH